MPLSFKINKPPIFCLTAFLAFVSVATGFASDHFPYLAEVSKESVNVRSGPNTNFEKIDKLSKATKVVVLGRNFEWLKVQTFPTTLAFIRSDYLKKQRGDVYVVLGENVNIRCKAGSNASSLGEVKKDTLVKVISEADGWSRIQPPAGTAAWIHQDFLKEISPDVPSELMSPAVHLPEETAVKVSSGRIITQTVSLQGTLSALATPPGDDVHYEIVIDNKSIYYLQDIPSLSNFANTVVMVDGTVVPDPQKNYRNPLLHINKIELVI
jgi:SH3-like domain-containing protein